MKKESMRLKKDIRAYEYEELQKELERLGEKPFRAKQIYEWLHVKLADRFDEMTNLSVKLREKLAEEYDIFPVQMAERQQSKLDGTNKFLFRLYDGNMVESVLMRYKHGNSVCISSQDDRGIKTESVCIRNARSDLPDPENYRREGFQRRYHGNRRAA